MHMKKRTAVTISLILILCLCFSSSCVWATPLSELQDQIEKKQEELKAGQKKEKDLSNKVNELEETIYELNDQIEVSEKQLDELKKDLEEAQKKVDEQNVELGSRLRTMYKNGSVGFLDVLMNSGSFSEFLTNIDLVEKIYAADKDVLEDLQAAHDEIEKKKNKVEKLSKELKDSKQAAEDNMATVESEKKKIAADNEKNAAMLDDLENEAAAEAADWLHPRRMVRPATAPRPLTAAVSSRGRYRVPRRSLLVMAGVSVRSMTESSTEPSISLPMAGLTSYPLLTAPSSAPAGTADSVIPSRWTTAADSSPCTTTVPHLLQRRDRRYPRDRLSHVWERRVPPQEITWISECSRTERHRIRSHTSQHSQ